MRKAALVLIIVLSIVFAIGIISAEKDFGQAIPPSFTPNVPVVKGSIISSNTFRSDELKRGIEVVVHTEQPFSQTVRFYKNAFAKTDPAKMSFSESTSESGKEVDCIGEVGPNQVVVMIREKQVFTEVTIQVLGNSILLLPK